MPFLVLVIVAILSSSAQASRDLNYFQRQNGLAPYYQIGSEWGKQVVTDKLRKSSIHLDRIASATAKTLEGATSFYIGEFNGYHVMATNHHICQTRSDCINTEVVFPIFKKTYKINKFFGTWSSIDLALFAIDVKSEKDAKELRSVGRNFSWNHQIYLKQPLLTVGVGIAENNFRELMVNIDSDCKVFSLADDFRFMADPDELNTGSYKAWSFANGCDLSHGDSGSAVLDRDTGDIVGILWTGKIPKNKKIQDSKYLNNLLIQGGSEIWTELSYGVPATKIKEYLLSVAIDPKRPDFIRHTISEIVK